MSAGEGGDGRKASGPAGQEDAPDGAGIVWRLWARSSGVGGSTASAHETEAQGGCQFLALKGPAQEGHKGGKRGRN